MDPADAIGASSLRSRVVAARTELGRMRCTDHAARDAILTVRLTEHTLSAWWLPALDGRRER